MTLATADDPIADIERSSLIIDMEIQLTLDALAGMLISAKRIPGNTIEVWLCTPPTNEDAVVISVEAPWRIISADGIVTTSAEIPWDQPASETDALYEARNAAARQKSDLLVGGKLVSAESRSETGDICLFFEDGLRLESFALWPDEGAWTLRLYAINRRLGPQLDEPISPAH